MSDEKKTGLALLREPFLTNQISKLPKPTKAQTEEVKADYKKGVRCDVCGGWHHPKVVHLDYVGHAALTDRLLDADPNWTWEPFAVGPNGLPVIDSDGGLWIKLTVCGMTRPGYGDAQGKVGGDAMKERIGDALRNAAMRFGAALDLWHKGDLHLEEDNPKEKNKHTPVNAAMEGVVIPDNIMEELRFLAAELVDFVESKNNPSAAYDLLESTRLSEDELPVKGDYLLALSQIMTPNSKTRSALKKEGEARRAKHQEEVKAAKTTDLAGAM